MSLGFGFGIGLRNVHFPAFLAGNVRIDWVEAITENFLSPGGRPRHVLRHVRRDRPVVLHGVSACLGSTDRLDLAYLRRVRTLADELDAAWVSDHLCWGSFEGARAHELLPLPFTEECLAHLATRISAAQDGLGRRLVVENVSSYVAFRSSELTEWEFLAELARRADCELLLDVNNVYVSARNHGFSAETYIDALPAGRVRQLHLAGHQDRGDFCIDTHDAPVRPEVWALYRRAIARLGSVSTLLERDDHIPPIDDLLIELELARTHAADVLATRAA